MHRRMRCLVHLLLAAVACSVARAASTKVLLAADLLKPDLQEISKYYEKGGQIPTAYIEMPKSIIFRVRFVSDDTGGHLRLDGLYALKSKGRKVYYELYYKNGGLFVTGNDGRLEEIPLDDNIYYTPPPITKTVPCLLVRYCDVEEIRNDADEFYAKHKHYIDTVVDEFPATFLGAHPAGPFVEYTYVGKNLAQSTSSLVRVITAEDRGSYTYLLTSTAPYKLVFHQNKHDFKVVDSHLNRAKNVFGLRTANEAFLAVIGEDKIKMLSKHDLYDADSLPPTPRISEGKLLQKSKTIEPRFGLSNKAIPPEMWMTGVRFQVHGVRFIKHINCQNGNISKECPFVIESEDKSKVIFFQGQWLDQICTDGHKLFIPNFQIDQQNKTGETSRGCR